MSEAIKHKERHYNDHLQEFELSQKCVHERPVLSKALKMQKDLVLQKEFAQSLSGEKIVSDQEEEKPSLLFPTTSFSGLNADDKGEEGHTISLIALIATVMSLQAKVNSNYWSTLWKQSAASMMASVQLAKPIGDAIRGAGNAQADATQQEAELANKNMMLCIIFSGLGTLMGGGLGVTSIAEEAEEEVGSSYLKEAVEDAAAPRNSVVSDEEAFSDEEEGMEMESLAERPQEDLAPNVAERTEDLAPKVNISPRWKDQSPVAVSTVSKNVKRVAKVLEKITSTMMGLSMIKAIGENAYSSQYKAIESTDQAEQGQQQAMSKEEESFQQFDNQDCSRSTELGSGMEDSIRKGLQTILDAASGLTQAVCAMFRG